MLKGSKICPYYSKVFLKKEVASMGKLGKKPNKGRWIVHLRYWSRLFWREILKSLMGFSNMLMILESIWSFAKGRSTGSKWFKDHMQIKKSQNDLRIVLQNFVFFKFLASNENEGCLVNDSSIARGNLNSKNLQICKWIFLPFQVLP